MLSWPMGELNSASRLLSWDSNDLAKTQPSSVNNESMESGLCLKQYYNSHSHWWMSHAVSPSTMIYIATNASSSVPNAPQSLRLRLCWGTFSKYTYVQCNTVVNILDCEPRGSGFKSGLSADILWGLIDCAGLTQAFTNVPFNFSEHWEEKLSLCSSYEFCLLVKIWALKIFLHIDFKKANNYICLCSRWMKQNFFIIRLCLNTNFQNVISMLFHIL